MRRGGRHRGASERSADVVRLLRGEHARSGERPPFDCAGVRIRCGAQQTAQSPKPGRPRGARVLVTSDGRATKPLVGLTFQSAARENLVLNLYPRSRGSDTAAASRLRETTGNPVFDTGNPWFGPRHSGAANILMESRVESLLERLPYLAVGEVADRRLPRRVPADDNTTQPSCHSSALVLTTPSQRLRARLDQYIYPIRPICPHRYPDSALPQHGRQIARQVVLFRFPGCS